MPRLIWSPHARNDIQRLHRFLAAHNPAAARRAVTAIQCSVKTLIQHPELGRPAEDEPENIRDWIIELGDSGYIARYRIQNDDLVILAVWHQREAGG